MEKQRRSGWVWRAAAWAAGVLLAVPLAAVLALHWAPVTTRIANLVLPGVAPWPDAVVSVGHADLDGFWTLTLDDMRVSRPEERGALPSVMPRPMVLVDHVRARFRLLPLLGRRLVVHSLEVSGVDVAMRQRPDSTWDLLAPFTDDEPSDAKETRSTVRYDIGRITLVDGRVLARFGAGADSVLTVREVQLRARTVSGGEAPSAIVDTAHAVLRPPGRSDVPVQVAAALRLDDGRVYVEAFRLSSDASDVRARGVLALPRGDAPGATDVDFRITAEPLDLRDIGAIVPGFDVPGSIRLGARARGSSELIEVEARGHGSDDSRLRLEGSFTPGTDGPVRYVMEAEVDDLDPALWGGPEGVRGLDATVDVALDGPALDSLTGTVSARASVTEVAEGSSLERTRLDARFERGAAEFELGGALVPWGTIEATGTVAPADGGARYDARIALVQDDVLTLGTTSLADAELVAQMEGTGLALEDAAGSARVDLVGTIGGQAIRDALLTGRWGEERARADLEVSIEAGRVQAALEADWSEELVRLDVPLVSARQLDIGAFLGDSVSGALSLEGNGVVVLREPESSEADVEAVLEGARWGSDLVVDSGRASLELRRGELTAAATLDSPGGSLALDVSGEPFDSARTWAVERLEVASVDLAALRPGLPGSDIGAVLRMQGRLGAPPTAVGGPTSGGRPEAARRVVADGTLSVRRSRVGAERIDTAEVRISFADGLLELDGEASALDGRLSVLAEASPLEDAPTFRVGPLRLEDVRVDSTLASPLRADLTGTLFVAGALPPDTFPRIEGTFELEPSPINFDQVAHGRATFSVLDARARVDAAAEVERGAGELHGVADLTRGADGAMALGRFELEGLVELPDDERVLLVDTMESALDARFRLTGSGVPPGGTFEGVEWDGTVSAAGRLGGARLDTLELTGRAADGVLHLDTLVLVSNVARASGGGSVAVDDTGAPPQEGIRARLDVDSLHAAGALSSVRPLSMRGATAELAATNPAGGGIRVDVRLAAGGVLAAAFAADTVSGTGGAAVRDGALRSASLRVDGEDLGWGAAFVETVSSAVDYDSAASAVAAFALSAMRDSVHSFSVSGTARPTDRTASLDEVRLTFPAEVWTLARPADLRWGDTIDTGGLTLAAGERRIALDGHLDRSGDQDLTLTLESVPLGGVAHLVGLERLTGTLDGLVRVTGPAADVALDGSVSADIGGTVLDVALSPAGADLGVEARLLDPAGQSLVVEGSVPFPLSIAEEGGAGAGGAPGGGAAEPQNAGRVSLDLRADEFSLEWLTPLLHPMGVEEWEAWLTADARLEGTLDAPRGSGSLGLAGGRVRVPKQGVAYHDIGAELELAGDRIDVQSLHVRSGGSADAEGTILLTDLANPDLDLRARLDRFRAVHNEWTRLGLSGELVLGGELRAPIVTGRMGLVDTDVFADPIGTAAGGGSPIELTEEDYAMLEAYFGLTPDRLENPDGDPLAPWAMDLTVELESDVWLRRQSRPELRLQMDGSLDVQKEAGDSIQLFGTLEVLPARSYFEELGRRFDVTSGTATFNGSMWDWDADIQAQYEVPSARDPSAPEVTITLQVTGGMDDLALTLGSAPPMETADVLSYMATGRPAASAVEFGQQGEGGPGGVVGAGAALALDQAASALERTAAESVGLDVVEIRHQGLDGATLIAGRYVSPRLFVGFQQPLTLGARPDDALTETSRGTEVEVEYSAYHWLLLSLEGGQSTVRFFLRTRHAF